MINNIEYINYYILTYILIALSGALLFMWNRSLLILFALYLFFLYIFKIKSYNALKKYLFLLSLASFIVLIQFYFFDTFILNSLLSIIILVTVSYLFNEILKENFISTYVKLIYYLSIVSLILFPIGIVSPSGFTSIAHAIDSIGIDPYYTSNILFFNFYEAHSTILGIQIQRNSGFVYEPGMFACLLIPALAFSTIALGTLLNRYNIIFIITILSTLSTAAYIALAILIFIYLLTQYRLSVSSVTFAIIVVLVGLYSFKHVEFIGEKVQEQYDMAIYGDDNQRFRGRFGSAFVDINEIKNYPLFGRGRHSDTRFDQSEVMANPEYAHRVNGIFDLLAAMGIPFFLVYLYLLYRRINTICLNYNRSYFTWLLFVLPYLVMASSQTILMRPLFFALLFLNPIQNFNRNDK